MVKFIGNTIFFGIVAVVLLVGANEIGRRLTTGSIRLDDELHSAWDAICEVSVLFGEKNLADYFVRARAESRSPEHNLAPTGTAGAAAAPLKESEADKSAGYSDTNATLIILNQNHEFGRIMDVVAATRSELKAGCR
ncbi:MAG: hypothetical protein WC299_04740 [Kiritimatiellia bacterium]